MDWTTTIIIAAIAAVISGVVCFILGSAHRKKTAEALIGSANEEATRIVNQAVTEAETKKRENILEAKDEIHRLRTETERELRDRRNEVQRQEKRLIQKEESLDKKVEALEKKEETLDNKIKQAEVQLAEAESIKRSQWLSISAWVETMLTSRPITSTLESLHSKAPFSSKIKPSGLIATETALSSTPGTSKTAAPPIYNLPPSTRPLNTLIGGVPRNFATKRLVGSS